MTEPRGRAARWQTAMLLVPGAAVTFGSVVAWAATSTPTATSVPGTSSAPTSRAVDRAAPAHAAQLAAYRHQLEVQISEHRRNAHQLQRQLAALRARAARLGELTVGVAPVGQVAPAPAPQAGVVVVPAPPPPVVAPPPPVHTVTGASGHP